MCRGGHVHAGVKSLVHALFLHGGMCTGLEPAASGISVALTVGNEDDVAVALTVDEVAA